jgi:hypothetical protein
LNHIAAFQITMYYIKKVQKLGSVGRSVDVTRYKDYSELRSAIDRMFGLGGKLDDPSISDWKLVYVDYENDVLLVGDDPWQCVSVSFSLVPSLKHKHDGFLKKFNLAEQG